MIDSLLIEGKDSKTSLKDAFNLIGKAWESASQTTIRNCWGKVNAMTVQTIDEQESLHE